MRSKCWGETNPHAQPLVEALRVARAKTTVPLLQERIQSCKTFLERARQRVARAESVIARAVEQKEIYVKEVSEGESRLQTFMSEEVSVPAHVSARRARVAEADRRVEKGTRFVESRTDSHGASRDVVRGWFAICEGDPTHANRPPRVARWISERNCDVRNALEFSDRATVAKMGSLSQGTAQLAVGSRDVVMDVSTRSALMASLIEESDAKRRVVQGANTSALPSMVGNQV